MNKAQWKKLVLANIVFALILVLACWLVVNRKSHYNAPVVPAFDSVAFFKARFDSIVSEVEEREHNEFLRQYSVDTAIKNQFNEEKNTLISAADSLDLVYREQLLAKLDATKFTY